jgi:glycosyltransferase involved in cell wall biosynthesis
MKLSLALTTYNRYDLTIQSFAKVIDDERIDEVVILDDASTDGSYEKLRDYFKGNDRVRVLRQLTNQNMSRNKRDAIAYCKNPFVIILDSDNTISTEYLDALEGVEFREDTIICPTEARPNFIYKKFAGRIFDRTNAKELVSDPMGNCQTNTANYVVPRDEYIRVYEFNPEMKATDTVYFSYLWLKAGYKFHIVKGMGYEHLNHPGSGFLQDLDYNMIQSEKVRQLILSL